MTRWELFETPILVSSPPRGTNDNCTFVTIFPVQSLRLHRFNTHRRRTGTTRKPRFPEEPCDAVAETIVRRGRIKVQSRRNQIRSLRTYVRAALRNEGLRSSQSRSYFGERLRGRSLLLRRSPSHQESSVADRRQQKLPSLDSPIFFFFLQFSYRLWRNWGENAIDMPVVRKEGKDTIMFVSKEDHAGPSKVSLPEPEPSPGLLLPSGEINWNCPCLGGMATGPCGLEFRDAFSCFHYSAADPKGSDCYEAFKTMQTCMSEYPALYGNKDPDLDDLDDHDNDAVHDRATEITNDRRDTKNDDNAAREIFDSSNSSSNGNQLERTKNK